MLRYWHSISVKSLRNVSETKSAAYFKILLESLDLQCIRYALNEEKLLDLYCVLIE